MHISSKSYFSVPIIGIPKYLTSYKVQIVMIIDQSKSQLVPKNLDSQKMDGLCLWNIIEHWITYPTF